MKWRAGEVIVRRGDPGDVMFVVATGKVEILLEDGRPNKVLGPGSFLGELAYINPNQPRTKTVLALTDCELRVLSQTDGDALIAAHPRAFLTLLRRTVGWMVESEQQLINDLESKNRHLQQTLDYLVRTREELTQQELLARTDALTGLYNRRCLIDQIDGVSGLPRKPGTGLALLLIDLDSFKEINDELGHPTGDRVLVSVARAIENCIRRSDLPCRLGGDEFAVLLTDVGPRIAAQRGQNLVDRLGQLPPPDPNRPELNVTATVGGAMFQPGDTAKTLLARADEQLYAAKRAGKARLGWAVAA